MHCIFPKSIQRHHRILKHLYAPSVSLKSPKYQSVHFRCKITKDSLLHTIQNTEVLHDLQVLSLAQEKLVGVLARLHGVHHGGGIGHAHLLGHLVGSCEEYSVEAPP